MRGRELTFPAEGRGAGSDALFYVIARARYEAADRPNTQARTLVELPPNARARFSDVHAEQLEQTFGARPEAVLTEYASAASAPDAALSGHDLSTLGCDVLFPEAASRNVRELEVEVAPPRMRGEYSSERVTTVVRQHLAEIRWCYQEAGPVSSRGGRIRVRFVIEGGAAEQVRVTDSTVGSAAVERCIRDAVARWEFPDEAGARGVHVEQSFVLSSRTLGESFRISDVDRCAMLANELVLTRLRHRRTDRGLALRAAAPIAGGREQDPAGPNPIWNEVLGPSVNAFSTRYVIRHPWAGPVDCAAPVRGVWSSAPPARPSSSAPAVARPGPPHPRPPGGCGGCAPSPSSSGGPLWMLPLLLVLRASVRRISR